MTEPIAGIHHVTALATDPQRNLDFYAGVLGLRLVKKTVNFDDPATYHFYFGDRLGRPGSLLTFFPWPLAKRGSRGAGQATATAFSVPEGSLGYWLERLEARGVVTGEPASRFEEEAVAFYDPDGLKLELVAHALEDGGEGGEVPLAGAPVGGPVPAEHAIRGFHSVTLTERELEGTVDLLTATMGWQPTAEAGDRHRLAPRSGGSGFGGIGTRVDLLHAPGEVPGHVAAGTVHHVAWRVPDAAAQAAWRGQLLEVGLHPTQILDRRYFESIYFREPGGVLFEFATDGPGFTRDEAPEELGSELKLPPWLEPRREEIEAVLPAVRVPA